jgi:hypothetical protein
MPVIVQNVDQARADEKHVNVINKKIVRGRTIPDGSVQERVTLLRDRARREFVRKGLEKHVIVGTTLQIVVRIKVRMIFEGRQNPFRRYSIRVLMCHRFPESASLHGEVRGFLLPEDFGQSDCVFHIFRVSRTAR